MIIRNGLDGGSYLEQGLDTSSFEMPSSPVFYDSHDTPCYLCVRKQCTHKEHFHERRFDIYFRQKTHFPHN